MPIPDNFPTPRPYQAEIIRAALRGGNTMVILPTGTGKTLIAFYLMLNSQKALMMAPTKPLAEQHYNNFKKFSPESVLVTGEIGQKKRTPLYSKRFVFATPQTIANDIEKGLLDIDGFELVVFDECHRAVGDYAYARIGKHISRAKVLGLTASPGGNKERIMEVVENLSIDTIEIRTEDQLKEFTAQKDIKRVYVSLPQEMMYLKAALKNIYDDYKKKMQAYGIPVPNRKGDFIALGNKIMNLKSASKFTLIPLYVSMLNLQHSMELLETQGLEAFINYLSRLYEERKSSLTALLNDPRFIEVLRKAKQAKENGVMHPKVKKLVELLKSFENKQSIVFVQYTDQIRMLVEFLLKQGIKAMPFMGKKQGFDKHKQRAVMDAFRQGKFDVLVSSSIGEEGIDVPSVDAVIFYEPVPSEIRSIQRKGRTGRVRAGQVIVLITKGTRDEGYFHASARKERYMKKIIEDIKGRLKKVEKKPLSYLPKKTDVQTSLRKWL